jgi:hypothetical protein
MRTLPVLRGAALAAAAATIALTGCDGHAATTHHSAAVAPPAGTAATAGWRGSTLIGPAAQTWTSEFAATAADDTWSAWQSCGSCQATGQATPPRVEHWNGAGWSQLTVPRSVAADAAAAVTLGASSASNAWLVAPGKIVHWNGTSWQAEAIPAWATQGSAGVYKLAAAVFGPSSAWLFSLGRNASPTPYYAARDTGGHWVKVPLPGSPDEVSALSPDDIWVLGATAATAATNNPRTILMHWDGTRWSTVTAPAATAPGDVVVNNQDLVATGPHDAWLVRQTQHSNADGQPVITGAGLLHWDGSGWSQTAIPVPAQTGVGAMAQDGAGGLWLATAAPAPAYTQTFYHYAGGHWSRAAVPGTQTTVHGSTRVTLTGLAWIPGTRKLWAFGDMLTGDAAGATPSDGLILSQGQ